MRFCISLMVLMLLIPFSVYSDSSLLPEKTTVVNSSESSGGSAKLQEPPWGLTVVLLMLGGFFFMFMEIAIIPGFGITGIIGILLLLGGITAAYLKLSTLMAVVATFAGIFGVAGLMLWFFLVFPKTRMGKQFVLETDSSAAQGFVAVENMQRYEGRQGVTLTMLRPSGIARIDGERVDVITDGEFVEKGVEIKVVKTGACRIIVAPMESAD